MRTRAEGHFKAVIYVNNSKCILVLIFNNFHLLFKYIITMWVPKFRKEHKQDDGESVETLCCSPVYNEEKHLTLATYANVQKWNSIILFPEWVRCQADQELHIPKTMYRNKLTISSFQQPLGRLVATPELRNSRLIYFWLSNVYWPEQQRFIMIRRG